MTPGWSSTHLSQNRWRIRQFGHPLRRSTAWEGVSLLGVCHEMRRNNTIEELQGTRNPFIDHPKRVEDIQF